MSRLIFSGTFFQKSESSFTGRQTQPQECKRSSYKNTYIKYIFTIYPVRRIILGGHSTGHVTDNPLPLLDSSSLQPPSTNTAAAAPLMRLAIAQRAAALARTCGFELPRDLTLKKRRRGKSKSPRACQKCILAVCKLSNGEWNDSITISQKLLQTFAQPRFSLFTHKSLFRK